MIPSLKRQLLLWLLVPLLVIMPIVAAVQYGLVLIPAQQEMDHQLGDYAIAVARILKVEDGQVRFDMTPQTEHLLRTDQLDTEFFLVIGPEGKIIAGDAGLNTFEEEISPGESRYVDRQIGGRSIRMLIYGVACGPNTCQVRIAETLVKRNKLHLQALIATFLSIVALGLTTAAVVLVAVRHGLRPLQELRAQLAERSLDDLRPLDVPKIPGEVQPLVTALNQLFHRLNEASKAQKSFLADAAHQLRTPLSALQTESELALLEPHPESLHSTLERLNRSATRATKLANQLLTIARADPSVQIKSDFAPVDLKEIASWAANEWSHQAIMSGVDLGFELDTAFVNGQTVLLQEMLSNLIHNSIEHAGKNARITVRTFTSGHASILEVEDDGPGIPEDDREKVLQRFFRGRNANGSGSGLGLAIVSEIARIHSARVNLDPPGNGKGLLIRISFESEQF
ncbi:sensor histidine kinase [Sideroxydans sp. CL21]|uniref:sensor histidine kinase n=1 Tax=Sideroxydans sp. CL21 TaxID=2600596 RepID=UPI0024BC96FD|nr:sensor histidine kinase [Sideroxydans sp. CL21]